MSLTTWKQCRLKLLCTLPLPNSTQQWTAVGPAGAACTTWAVFPCWVGEGKPHGHPKNTRSTNRSNLFEWNVLDGFGWKMVKVYQSIVTMKIEYVLHCFAMFKFGWPYKMISIFFHLVQSLPAFFLRFQKYMQQNLQNQTPAEDFATEQWDESWVLFKDATHVSSPWWQVEPFAGILLWCCACYEMFWACIQ